MTAFISEKDGINTLTDKSTQSVSMQIGQIFFSGTDGLSEIFKSKFGFSPRESDQHKLFTQGKIQVLVDTKEHASVLRITDIVIELKDINNTIKRAKNCGATILEHQGIYTIQILPHLRHSLNNISQYDMSDAALLDSSFQAIDHVAICVPEEDFDLVIEQYKYIFELEVCHEEVVETKTTSMDSLVLSNISKEITLVFMKPKQGKEKSQIQRFMDVNEGAGFQHIAFSVHNILSAVAKLKREGIEFLDVPDTYYDALKDRIKNTSINIDDFKELGVLVDEDEDGLLLQVFTKPLLNNKTVFIELIERYGSLGFGSGNIKALFKAVEQNIKENS